MSQELTTVDNPGQRKWILVALMCTIMLAAMDTTIVSTAIPHIVGDLGGFALFSWVFSIYLLAQTVTIPIYGKLADLYGRKPILLFGIIVFLISSAASAAAWNMMALIVFRGVQGIGAGAIMATVNTLAGDLYSIEERARIQGWLSSVWGMAAIVGPTLGGAFADYMHWRWIFLINIPIGILSMYLISAYLKEEFEKKKHHIDYPGAIAMLFAGGLLIYALMEGGQAWAWTSTTGISIMLATVFFIFLTIYIEKRSPEPIMPLWVWKRKILIGSNLAMIFMGVIMLGPNMYLPVFAQSVYGVGAIAAGLVLASSSIGWPIASSQSGKLYMRIGFRNTAMIGTILLIGFALLFRALPYQYSIWLIVMNQILLGAGFGLLSTPTLVGVQSIVPWGKRGVVTSSNMFSRYLGQSIGAAVMGSSFNSFMQKKLSDAPADISGELPLVNDVIDSLQSPETSESVFEFLQHSFHASTNHVFLVMAIFAGLALLSLTLLPRRYPIVDEKKEGAGKV